MTAGRLDEAQQELLCDLADPEAPPPSAGALAIMSPDDCAALAAHHAIEPAVWRKLQAIGEALPPGWRELCRTLQDGVRIATIVTMTLEGEARQIAEALRGEGARYSLVKGAAFAADLYPQQADRPFTDLDVLLPPGDLEAAGRALTACGYSLAERRRPEKYETYREEKWVRPGEEHLLVELHTDLVHQPGLRRRVTYGFDQLRIADGDGEAPLTGHLLTAVVHGALGHKFHQLKLAVDVLQAMRRLPAGEVDTAIAAARRLNLTFELAASARLVRALFPHAAGDANIARLAGLARVPAWLDRDTVVNAHLRGDIQSRSRRHLFRWHQRLLPGKAAQ